MNNIEKAINVEKEYFEFKQNNGYSPFVFADKIREFGFNSEQEYLSAKQEYRFNNVKFNYVETPMPDGVSEIFKMINANKAGVLFVDWEDTFVVCADRGLKEFNKQYCEENSIAFFPLYTGGGTIVGSKGDFSFGVCCPKNIVYNPEFILNGVQSILKKYATVEVVVDGNDITVGGKKICGSAHYEKDDVFMVIMHFSFADRSDLISNVCLTTKAGKPVGYIDFMTRAKFKREVAEWLRVCSI